MAAPTVSDVQAFLANRCGVDTSLTVYTDTATITKALNWALTKLRQVTGYDPFVYGSAADMTVEVVGLTGRLPNGANGTIVVSKDGTTYVDGTDYRLYPLNGSPKQYFRWINRNVVPTKPVTVNAQWGRASDYPDDVWEAIVMLTAAFCLVAFASGQAGILGSSWTDGDVSVTYAVQRMAQTGGAGVSSMPAGALAAEAVATFENYKRVVAWG